MHVKAMTLRKRAEVSLSDNDLENFPTSSDRGDIQISK